MTLAPTATPQNAIPVPVDPPPGFWQREASHYPQPLTPVFRPFLDWTNEIWYGLAIEHGMMFDGVEFQEIGGWTYQRLRPIGGKDRKAPPAPIMWLLVRTVPALRKRIGTLIRGVRADIGMQQLDAWLSHWKDEQIATIARLRATDLSALNDDELNSHFDAVVAFARESLRRHFELTMPISTVAELAFACQELLNWGDHEALDLLAGLSVASTEPARRLTALAAMAAERPAVRALLEDPDASTLARIEATDPEFAAAFHAYQHEFGCRALRYEVIDPTLEEVPELTLGLIHDQLERGYDAEAEAAALRERREGALSRARGLLRSRSAADRERFERLLSRAERYYPTREDNEFYTVSAPLALFRYALLEYGHRLADRGAISRRDDVFFLEFAELRRALDGASGLTGAIERRKREREWVLAHPGPASFGTDPGGPPPLKVFPAEAAHNIRMILWATEKVFGAEAARQHLAAPSAGAASLQGVAAASGSYTGPARVVMDENDFDKVEPGDVLVCPITSPVWSIVFPSIGALVTDTGGILSHPAIIAREYGIPAVVATGSATSMLKDGQMITVDGVAGTVTPAVS